MRSLKFYLPTWDHIVARMLNDAGHTTVAPGEEYDVLMFTGGADVSPSLYKQAPMPRTQSNPRRDVKESGIFRKHKKIPKVGICRGGQFLNVMSGGSMWQHVEGHCNGPHLVKMLNGEEIMMTSTHHQMIIPHHQGVVLGKAMNATYKESPTVKRWLGGDTSKNNWEDVEIVWYPGTLSLCFQPHPEYETAKGRCRERFFELIDTFIIGSMDNARNL